MAVTARIGGGGSGFEWEITYDDVTRNVTTTATGPGFHLVTVQITATITRSVAYKPAGAGASQNGALAAQMAAADFQVASDGQVAVLASNVNPAQVTRILSKSGTIGGLNSTSIDSMS